MSGAQIQAKVRAGLERAGRRAGNGPLTATITRFTGADETTYPPTPGTPTSYTAGAMVEQYSARDRDGTEITARDTKVVLSVPLMDAAGNQTEPKIGDTLSIGDGRDLRIVNVDAEQPGGVVLYWECQARASNG